MAIATFALLKQAIERWSHRTDISDVIDNFIELAENDIDKRLLLRSNELRATVSASTSERFLALPDRFLKMRRLTIAASGNQVDIRFKAPDQMRIEAAAGTPRYFTVSSQIEFDRVPDSAYTIEMQYFSRLNPLSTSNTTNDVLTDYPDLYLWGSLSHLAMWEKDLNMVAAYQAKFDDSIVYANKQERKGRYGPTPTMTSEGSTP